MRVLIEYRQDVNAGEVESFGRLRDAKDTGVSKLTQRK